MHICFCRLSIFSLMLFCIAASIFLIGAQPAFAQIDSRLKADGWKEFTFDDKKQNIFKRVGEDIVEIQTNSSVSIAYLPFDGKTLDLRETPTLVFEWQHEGQIIDTDVSKKGGDDRILAIYLAFPYQPEDASFKEKLMRPLVVASQGREAPGRLLTYIWAGAPEVGRWFENPYTGKAGYMQVIQGANDASNNPDIWRQHKVNIAEDFKDRFGYFPPNPAYVAIGVDSDDTHTTAITRVRGLGFVE
ncbi:MAG: DUF3047 domain-containing protein [Candidatus Puniceispirillaceae bacterium]